MIKKVSEKKELEQIHELACYAFNSAHSEEKKGDYIEKNRHTTNYVITNEAKEITSQVICYPFNVTIEGQQMKMAGIGDVASYPETRGNGSIRQLFSTLFADLHQNQTPLSYLAPFSQVFYRKFGYENVFNPTEVRIPKRIIAQIVPETSGLVRRVSWEQEVTQHLLKTLYQKTLGQQNGTLVRPDFWWNYFLSPNNPLKIAICYDESNRATGYLLYQLVDNTDFIVKELVYENATAMKQLLTFISSHSGSFESFVFSYFTDEMLLTQFTETQGIEQVTQSGMMVRIVSIKDFIEQYPFKQKKEAHTFYLNVIDKFCPWNHGVFKLTIKEGHATCTKKDQVTSIDYSGTIEQWTPVLMGVYSLNQGVSYELIERKSTDDLLSDLIKTNTPRLYDYF